MVETITQADPLLGVEVRHLVALASIARTGSFSGAARELGYAQSAISQQIATLERAAGHRLLDRPGGPRKVVLTEAGRLVLQHADAITSRLGAIRADLDGLAAGVAGRLRLGVFQSASARILPVMLPHFRAEWPDIEVSLHNVLDISGLERSVLAGDLDIAFSELDWIGPDLESVQLLIDPFVALVDRAHPLAKRKHVGWKDFEGLDRVAYSDCDSQSQFVAKSLAEQGISTRIVFEADDNLTLQRLVGLGLGLAILPSLAVEQLLHNDNTVVVPFAASARVQRRIGLVWHRERYMSAATSGFISIAQRVIATGGPPTAPGARKAG